MGCPSAHSSASSKARDADGRRFISSKLRTHLALRPTGRALVGDLRSLIRVSRGLIGGGGGRLIELLPSWITTPARTRFLSPLGAAETCPHRTPYLSRTPTMAAAVGYAELKLLNGDAFVVEGTLDEVERKLSDAARSGQSRLAWFTEYGTDGSVGVNPAHVASLKVSEISG